MGTDKTSISVLILVLLRFRTISDFLKPQYGGEGEILISPENNRIEPDKTDFECVLDTPNNIPNNTLYFV